MYLVTFWGTFVCLDTVSDRLYQSDFQNPSWSDTLLDIKLPADFKVSAYIDFVLMPDKNAIDLAPDETASDSMIIRHAGKYGSVTVSRNGRYLCAKQDLKALDYSRDTPSAWEIFLLVDIFDLNGLRDILSKDWVICSTGSLIRREQINVSRNSIRLDLMKIDILPTLRLWKDLRSQRSISKAALSKETSFYYDIIVDGWKVERIRLYDPCVFFTAFKSVNVLGQLYLSIKSLLVFGSYRGHIHVITDQKKEDILAAIPQLESSKLTIQSVYAEDFTGYVSAKYLILDSDEVCQYQPMLFSDPDIIYDRPIEKMLRALVSVERVSAPLEDFSLLRVTPSVGASLLQRDGFETREACGFNGGTVGFLNTAEHGRVLAMIRGIVMNYMELSGRGSLLWVDQEVANYVGYKTGSVNTSVLTPFVRYGFSKLELDVASRVGLVHFWPPRKSQEKLHAMREYYAKLAAEPYPGDGLAKEALT
jgi:hypothetical protein